MIGFWATDVRAACQRRLLGACGPVPRPTRGCSWPNEIAISDELARGASGLSAAARAAAHCHRVPQIAGSPWEQVPAAAPTSAAEAGALAARSKGSVRRASTAASKSRTSATSEGAPQAAELAAGDRLGAAAAARCEQWDGLSVPEARNHRFFVRQLSEFRETLC